MKKFAWILAVALSLGLYAKVLGFGMIWDDRPLFHEVLPHYKNFFDPFVLKDLYGLPAFYYRPFIMISYLFDRAIWGENLFGFHFTLWVVHALATLLTYFVTLKLSEDRKESAAIALAASLLFASHPIHAEVTAWISGRPDGWLAVFGLSSFLFFLNFRTSLKKSSLLLSYFFFFLALLSKETAMLLFPCFLIYDFLFPLEEESHPSRILKRRHLGYLFLVLLFLGARHYFLGKSLIPYLPGGSVLGFLDRVVSLYGYYIWKVIWPFPLNAFQLDLPEISWAIPTGFLLLMALFLYKKSALGLYFLLFFLILLIPPVIVLLQPMQVAERYLYLPSFAFCFLVGFLLFYSSKWKTLKWVCLLILVGVWSFKTVERLKIWSDEKFFWEAAMTQNPQYGGPVFNLATAYHREKNGAKALFYYEKSLQAPKNTPSERALAYNSIGALYYDEKNYDQAVNYMRKALSEAPISQAFCNLGGLLSQKREFLPEAEKNLVECVKTTSKDLQEWQNRLNNVRRELEQH